MKKTRYSTTYGADMGLFKRCEHTISSKQLEVIGKMYPYDILCYNKLRPELIRFLTDEFSDAPGDTKIIDLSQHNGRGRKWGVVLLQFPGETTWQLVGQFGNDYWYFKTRPREIGYFYLVHLGSTFQKWPGPAHTHHVSEENIRCLKDLPSFCSWLDNFDPMEEFFKLGGQFAAA